MQVEVRNNNAEVAGKILKKKLQKDGFYIELQKREYYITRNERRRLEKAAGRRRWKRMQEKKKGEEHNL